MWLLFVTGLLSILTQIVLLRELNAAFYGVELIYLLALAAWLLCTAIGAAATTRTPLLHSAATIGVACAALAPVLLAEVMFLRAVGLVFGGVPGAFLPFWQQLVALTIALAPIGALLGLLFQWSARRFVGARRTLAQAYAIESTGAVAGGVLATILLGMGAQTLTLALLCAFFSLAAPLAPMAWQGRRVARAAVLVLSMLAAGLFWQSATFDRHMTRWQHPNLLEVRDSPYARVTLTRLADQIAVFENNALVFDSEGTDAEVFAHLVALQHPAPARVLLLGGGPEGLARFLFAHRPARLDNVELDPVLVDLVARHVSVSTETATADARAIIDDPRRFLRHSGRYDVMVIGMPEPDSGAANRFYTREFFELCAARLTPGGVVGLRLRTAENFWTPAETERTASIYRALRAAFADVVLLPGATNVVVASQAPLARDAGVLIDRLATRDIRARVVTPAYLRYLYTNDRRAGIARQLEASEAQANTDVRPACYQYAAIIWLGKFWPVLARFDPSGVGVSSTAGRLVRWGVAVVLLFLFLGARRHPSRRRLLIALVAGFSGMAIETVLLLHYQLKQGALFEDLGVLLTSFMGGLALGAIAARRLRLVHETIGGRRAVERWWGLAMVAGLSVLCGGVAALVATGVVGGLFGVAFLLALAGFFVAALFAYASVHQVGDQQTVISPLYAADLVGGCAGSLVATLILIPMAGLASTALWTSLFAALILLLL